jgi:hypothetical protein
VVRKTSAPWSPRSVAPAPTSSTSAVCTRKPAHWFANCVTEGLKDVKFMSDDGIVTDELVTTAGGPQYVDGVLMTFGADPRCCLRARP